MDEALLAWATVHGSPTLRFYGWAEPAATFGYFQRYAEVETWTQLRPLIRRPTGGGLVPHDADWTYSIVFPPDHDRYELRAVDSYRWVHDWICRAFQSLGVATVLAPTAHKEIPGRCFVGAEQFDLMREGTKMAGAAQRRNRHGLLIQGSVQPGRLRVERQEWEDAMEQSLSRPSGVEWHSLQLSSAFEQHVSNLVQEKYSQASYNRKR